MLALLRCLAATCGPSASPPHDPYLSCPTLQVACGFTLLQLGSSVVLEPGPSLVATPPDAQCQWLVSNLVVLLGFVLPLAFSAAWQWEQFRQFAAGQGGRVVTHPAPWWGLQEHLSPDACQQLGACCLLMALSVGLLYLLFHH